MTLSVRSVLSDLNLSGLNTIFEEEEVKVKMHSSLLELNLKLIPDRLACLLHSRRQRLEVNRRRR